MRIPTLLDASLALRLAQHDAEIAAVDVTADMGEAARKIDPDLAADPPPALAEAVIFRQVLAVGDHRVEEGVAGIRAGDPPRHGMGAAIAQLGTALAHAQE